MIAKTYLNKLSKEYYRASNRQVTINIPDENNLPMLNSDGIKLFNSIKEKIDNNQFTNIIIDYILMPFPSGMWINDTNSIHCEDPKINATLNSFDNIKIYGVIKKTRKIIITSNVIMYGLTWCYTSGDHLYKLENKFISQFGH